jgi:hypothetical protein
MADSKSPSKSGVNEFSKLLKGEFRDIAEAYEAKLNNVFGVSWETVAEFLSQKISKTESGGLIALAPIIVKSITSKDGGHSDVIMRKLAGFECMQKYNIKGRSGVTHNVNKSLARLVSLSIIKYVTIDLAKVDAKLERAYTIAGNQVSVMNIKGSEGGEEAKRLAAEAESKIGKMNSEMRDLIKTGVATICKASGF